MARSRFQLSDRPHRFAVLSIGERNQYKGAMLGISAAALIPVAVGMCAGQKLRDFVLANVFKTSVLVIVLLSGLAIIAKVVAGAG